MRQEPFTISNRFRGKLIVSCQAPEGDAFRDPASMARFARAAVGGGAAAIRANGPADVGAIRAAVDVPIIGIDKVLQPDGKILVTPSFDVARELKKAGADLIALDCTARGCRYGALETVARIKSELRIPVLADIATVAEAAAAAAAGADFVLSTLRGYTPETEDQKKFEPSFIAGLVRAIRVPVIAEGRIDTPSQARAALAAGAFAVVVGSAITRPAEIASRFARALDQERAALEGTAFYAAIDLGATNTKFGIVRSNGELLHESFVATPQGGGREALLGHLKEVARECVAKARRSDIVPGGLGVATAGWVNPWTGQVAYATENLPGWTGTPIAQELHAELGLPAAVENDANALAAAERHFGAARGVDNFVCLTLGTGLGGGCYVGGRLNRGGHFFANALGHVNIEPEGLPCTCGQRGCLEVYANAAALVRYAAPGFSSAEEVIRAANAGVPGARRAVRLLAGHLARGCASIIHVLDPELIIISGGLAQNNPALICNLREELARRVLVWPERALQLRASMLGYYGGVLGAAAIVIERMDQGA